MKSSRQEETPSQAIMSVYSCRNESQVKIKEDLEKVLTQWK